MSRKKIERPVEQATYLKPPVTEFVIYKAESTESGVRADHMKEFLFNHLDSATHFIAEYLSKKENHDEWLILEASVDKNNKAVPVAYHFGNRTETGSFEWRVQYANETEAYAVTPEEGEPH